MVVEPPDVPPPRVQHGAYTPSGWSVNPWTGQPASGWPQSWPAWRPRSWPQRRRTRWWVVLVVAAVVGQVVTIAATHNPRGYIYLDKLAHPALASFAGLAALAIAAYIGIRDDARRRIALKAVTVLAVMAACGWGAVSAREPDPPTQRTVLASYGHFVLVRYTTGVDVDGSGLSDGYVLFVERHDGIFSRVGHDKIACFFAPDAEIGPHRTLRSARFTNGHTVELTTLDGVAWVVSFDPATLRPVMTVDRCSNALTSGD